MALKKAAKSKFVQETNENSFININASDFLKGSPKTKKSQKRQKNSDSDEVEDISKLIEDYQSASKRKKVDNSLEACKESRQKLIDVMGNQLSSRKLSNNRLLKDLSDILAELESDCNILKENEQKLEHLTGALLKCIQQSNHAYKQKLKTLKEIHAAFQKEVEGLLSRGAMKLDDRPLWFDVYKAFPPVVEPKFAKPKPEVPIRPILYKEDVIRVEFHSRGHGLGTVNMLSHLSESHTKKLLKAYEKLKSEGVKEDELIEKSVATVDNDRKTEVLQKPKITAKNPDSVTAQILANTDLKNIFNDK